MPNLARVTSILADVGLAPDFSGIAPSVLERARRRGSQLHEAIEAHHYGYLDPGMLDEEGKGYFAGYEAFLADTQHRPLVSEVEVISRRWGYVGHADRVGWMGADRALVDWKSTVTLDVDYVSVQLAAYKLAYDEMHPKEPIKRLLGVQFQPDGRYRVHEVTNIPEATQLWQACVLVYKAKERRVA